MLLFYKEQHKHEDRMFRISYLQLHIYTFLITTFIKKIQLHINIFLITPLKLFIYVLIFLALKYILFQHLFKKKNAFFKLINKILTVNLEYLFRSCNLLYKIYF